LAAGTRGVLLLPLPLLRREAKAGSRDWVTSFAPSLKHEEE
jgi:hypothetical protein